MILRGVSLVLEGVHVVPGNELIKRWEDSSGGVALGICLTVLLDEKSHKSMLLKRGQRLKKQKFERVRAIHDEMNGQSGGAEC